jgi:acetyl-CoA carboxylase biotin carboxyl carrier protein
MAEQPSGPSDPLDVERIHYLVRLMKRYDLTALDLNDGPVQIRLRRRSPHPAPPDVSGRNQPAFPAPASHGSSLTAPPAPEPPVPTIPTAPKTVVIESPMVGTYYASSAPDAPPFVSVGTVVQPDTVVCIIEAMKVFTDIPAGVSGTIAEVLVKNGQAVEYSQPLFRVVPA